MSGLCVFVITSIDVLHKDFQKLRALNARVNGLGSARALHYGIYTKAVKKPK